MPELQTAQPQTLQLHTPVTIARGDFQRLLDALGERGYSTVGPTIRNETIVYDQVTSVDDLPVGWTDDQQAGAYRLQKSDRETIFGFAVGPTSWKQFLHPPEIRLWQAVRSDGHFELVPEKEETPRLALLGVRACDLHAIQILDQVLMSNQYVDPEYRARRENIFIVAVNCSKAGGTCFCVSMDTGPDVPPGYDIVVTEIVKPERHFFVAEAGTDRGLELLSTLPYELATADEVELAECTVAAIAKHMGRQLETEGLKDLLYRNLENPQWEAVADRCLTCGNCTLVCPTCFCTTVEDVTDLTGQRAERWRKSDSCFRTEFSHIYGGNLRASAKSRYRQWMTHKLAYWVDQFGTFGCVGCGRCITWCPVGIDITAEAQAIRRTDVARTTT